jgi:hypothetical protein
VLFPAGMKSKYPNIKINKGGVAFPDPSESGESKRPPSLSSDHLSNGGQTTISPPAKVNNSNSDKIKVIAHGIDSLNIAVDVEWLSKDFFDYLAKMKTFAIENGCDETVIMSDDKGSYEHLISIKQHGTTGYEWLLIGKEFTLKIGNWMTPMGRPSVMVEIRSELLWRMGPENALNHVLIMIEDQKSLVKAVKTSRVDLCADILLPDSIWNDGLKNYMVKRAGYIGPHYFNEKLTGLTIGRGFVTARLYDKPLEIMQKSNKRWMFDVWGTEAVPEGMNIIRVEFQLRREALKELSMNTDKDLFGNLDKLWAYCTEDWLKFQDNPGKHHTQRKTLDWWKIVQHGFAGNMTPNPLIRDKAMYLDSDRCLNSALGYLISLTAIEREIKNTDLEVPVTKDELFHNIERMLQDKGIDENYLNGIVLNKRSKIHRSESKTLEVHKQRLEQGHPSKVPFNTFIKEICERPSSFGNKLKEEEKKPDYGDLFEDDLKF